MSFHTCCFHFGEAKLLKQSIEGKKKTISTSSKQYIIKLHGFTVMSLLQIFRTQASTSCTPWTSLGFLKPLQQKNKTSLLHLKNRIQRLYGNQLNLTYSILVHFNYRKTPRLGSFIGYHFNKRRNNIFGSSLMDNLIMLHQWPVTS